MSKPKKHTISAFNGQDMDAQCTCKHPAWVHHYGYGACTMTGCPCRRHNTPPRKASKK